MVERLVLNPYLQFRRDEGSHTRFVFFAPKPGVGQQRSVVDRAERRDLFDVLDDLAGTDLKFLNINDDLTTQQRDLLVDNAVLVDAASQPVKPLFACDLETVAEHKDAEHYDEYVVDPTFRFEPFDLKNFAERSRIMGLEPGKPSVWVKAPATGVALGFWISHEAATVISTFEPGGSLPADLDAGLLRRLITAGVVVTPDSLDEATSRRQRSIDKTRNEFAQNKYAVMRQIFPPEQVEAMRAYYRQYVDQGFMPFGDDRVERRYREHNEVLTSFFHKQLTPLVSTITGTEVKPAYSYAATYVGGSILPPHTDRRQCEYSISFQLDYEPTPADNVSPWGLYLEPLQHEGELPELGVSIGWDQLDSAERGAQPAPIHLANGDGLIYKGRELVHYRHALPGQHRSTSLFFHFVDRDFAGELD